jgi:hypothetical protein
VATVREWDRFDYFFVHYKSQTRGETAISTARWRNPRKVDDRIAELVALSPDVLMITGDHSAPAVMAGHSGIRTVHVARPEHPKRRMQHVRDDAVAGVAGHLPRQGSTNLAMASRVAKKWSLEADDQSNSVTPATGMHRSPAPSAGQRHSRSHRRGARRGQDHLPPCSDSSVRRRS